MIFENKKQASRATSKLKSRKEPSQLQSNRLQEMIVAVTEQRDAKPKKEIVPEVSTNFWVWRESPSPGSKEQVKPSN